MHNHTFLDIFLGSLDDAAGGWSADAARGCSGARAEVYGKSQQDSKLSPQIKKRKLQIPLSSPS